MEHTGQDFDEYVRAAWPRLVRSAWLLTGDWYRAEDLVQTVLARAYGHWQRIRDNAPDAYLRSMMATTHLSWWRRRWRGEVPHDAVPEPSSQRPSDDLDLRATLAAALQQLPRQQRAVLMLRYHADLTETATAHVMGISVGTVKSYTARALHGLRRDQAIQALATGELEVTDEQR
ncbi:SigE family RNA polymerase sigma factor [Hamadaea sp. NPDC051192]|uniref:SigE family RNA polymerase sigma factor n=1 Tax=Hamadaea sp. NPDC051192 TaxID=3154940 RepID=UPI00343A7548